MEVARRLSYERVEFEVKYEVRKNGVVVWINGEFWNIFDTPGQVRRICDAFGRKGRVPGEGRKARRAEVLREMAKVAGVDRLKEIQGEQGV